MKRALVASLLLCGLILLGGAIRPDRDPGFNDTMSLGFRGGNAAEWDTAVVIMATFALSAGDTFALPATPNADETARIYELNDIYLGRGTKSWRGSNAMALNNGDKATFLRLGTGNAVPTFAYADIARDTVPAATGGPSGYKNAQGLRNEMFAPGRIYDQNGSAGNGAQYVLNLKNDIAAMVCHLIYVPWASVIPANATIIDASMNVNTSSAWYFVASDSVIATQMNRAADNYWYLQKGLAGLAPNHPNYAGTAWLRQYSARWSGGSAAHPWTLSAAQRSHVWDWGSVSDWTGSTLTGSQYFAQGKNVSIALTNCVQSCVNGGANNGIMVRGAKGDGSGVSYLFSEWDATHAAVTTRAPYIVVRYITKKYTKPFATAEWALAFMTDDGNKAFNTAIVDTFVSHRGKYTLYIAKTQVKANNSPPQGSAPADIYSYWQKGMEVGSHSRWHYGLSGMVGGSYSPWFAVTDTVDLQAGAPGDTLWSGMCHDVAPKWLYAMGDSIDAANGTSGSMRASGRWAKSFGAPTNQISNYGQLALERAGYLSYRYLASQGGYDSEKYYVRTYPAANGDSAVVAQKSYVVHKRNMAALYPNFATYKLFGGKGAMPANSGHIDSVKMCIRRAIFQVNGNDGRRLVFFDHSFKSDMSYTYGIEAEDISATLTLADSLGARYMTAAELAEWDKGGATMIAYPFGAAKADTFRQTAGQRIWGDPKGVDNGALGKRFIRGIR